MAVIISSKNKEKKFTSNRIITVGSSDLSDFCLKGIPFEIILEFNEYDNTYTVTNNTYNVPLFKGEAFKQLTIVNVARFLFPDSDEFINVKVLSKEEAAVEKKPSAPALNFSFEEKDNLQNKLNNMKNDIDERRIEIVKQISHQVNDIKSKLSQNLKGMIFSHVALFFGCLVCAFAVTNYISGLSIQESADYIHLPSDIKLWILYTILILGIMFLFKHGMYGYFYSQSSGTQPKMSKVIQTILILTSMIMMAGVYTINLIYYLDYTKALAFPVLISLFFVGITITLGISAAYCRCNGSELAERLNKYEFREDFEKVIKDYQMWINYYVNSLSAAKMQYIQDNKIKLRIREVIETIIGIIISPFLAYGVSNTLALCFPEAAGWIRISGIRFSPIFLVLASCMIIFAFFLFVHGFFLYRKINNSDVIKHDGFSNYLIHCADILGNEGTNNAQREMKFAFYAATIIIFIEFTMNVSYFVTELGQDFYGLFISIIAALVPTALLIAETFIQGNTKFNIYALESIGAKTDK